MDEYYDKYWELKDTQLPEIMDRSGIVRLSMPDTGEIKFWLFGGRFSQTRSYLFDGLSFEAGPELPQPMEFPCAAQVNTDDSIKTDLK